MPATGRIVGAYRGRVLLATVLMAIAALMMFVGAIVYMARNRRYQAPMGDDADEMAMRADKFVNRSGGGGLL